MTQPKASGDDLYTPAKFQSWVDGARRSAGRIVPLVLDWVKPSSVVDVGCGIGAWLSVFQAAGVGRIQGFDGHYVQRSQLLVPGDRFEAVDLARELPTRERFDLAVSVEVAEHLPPERSATFVRDLTRLAPVVLFSAAAPEQSGTGHIQEQWPAFWTHLFREHGYTSIDCLRPRIWEDDAIEWWYRQNAFLAVARERLERDPVLADLAARHGPPPALVHPQNLLRCAGLVRHFENLDNHGLRKVVGALPRLLRRWITGEARRTTPRSSS